MLIHPGTQELLINETTTAAGSTSKQGSIQSDSLLATLWVNSVTSGTLTVTAYTLTDEGKEVALFSFPVLATGTVDLLLKKSGVSMQRFRIVATYTGVCSYEVYVRAVEGAGESSTRILGSSNWQVSQVDVPTGPPVELIPTALTDRNGVLVKNWSGGGTLYIAESSAKATAGEGYPLGTKDGLSMDISAGSSVWAFADAGTVDVRIAESGT